MLPTFLRQMRSIRGDDNIVLCLQNEWSCRKHNESRQRNVPNHRERTFRARLCAHLLSRERQVDSVKELSWIVLLSIPMCAEPFHTELQLGPLAEVATTRESLQSCACHRVLGISRRNLEPELVGYLALSQASTPVA